MVTYDLQNNQEKDIHNLFKPLAHRFFTTHHRTYALGAKSEIKRCFEHPYPTGTKNYSKSNPINFTEFDLEKKWWDKRTETDYAWKVSIKDIKKRNFNLDISSPYYGEDDERITSGELMNRLEKSLSKSQELLSKLKMEF